MPSLVPPLCVYCRHRLSTEEGLVCAAFPNGIPDAILDSTHDHRKPYKGDGGVRFEQAPGAPEPRFDWLFPEDDEQE